MSLLMSRRLEIWQYVSLVEGRHLCTHCDGQQFWFSINYVGESKSVRSLSSSCTSQFVISSPGCLYCSHGSCCVISQNTWQKIMVEYGFWARVSELIDTLDSRVPSMIGEISKLQSPVEWIELSWHCWSLDESDYWFPHTFNCIINSLIASFQLWQCDINTCRKLVIIMPVYLIADNLRVCCGD